VKVVVAVKATEIEREVIWIDDSTILYSGR